MGFPRPIPLLCQMEVLSMNIKNLKFKPGCGLPLIFGVLIVLFLAIGSRNATPVEPSVSPSPSVSSSVSSSVSAASPTPEVTPSPEPTPVATPTPEPTPTSTPVPTEAPTPEPEPTSVPAPQEEPVEEIVYWTPNGKSYHSTEGCRTLSRSKTILSGTVSEAIASGHGDPCDVCH